MRSLLAIVCWLSFALAGAQEVHIPLHDGWSFSQVGKEQWYPAEVPGVVHTDLLRNGLIPDPYIGSNIDSVQWIENEAWIYKRTIVATDTLLKHGHLDLVFKGLDTFAEVYLNDSLLGKADNMFRSWEWDVKGLLKLGNNDLKVIFRSPIKEGARLRDAYGIQLPHDSDPSGVSPYIRKAAYQFGWDFCPRLVTSGIWQAVELHCWNKAIFSTVNVYDGSPNDPAYFGLSTFFWTEGCDRAKMKIILDGKEIRTLKFRTCDGGVHSSPSGIFELVKDSVELWWPVGSGEQRLYDVRLELYIKNRLEAVHSKRYGFRKVELDQERDSIGRPFRFIVNGEPIYMKGCNMIPPSMFLAEVGDSAWVAQVRHMQRAGMNMVRVWAGGVYPPDAFFDACDTAGIVVWQDLMFGNMVPGHVGFAENARSEFNEQLDRWGDHPCVVMLCGNNELEVAWKNWGWQDRYGIHGSDSVKVEQDQWDFFHKKIPFGLSGIPYTPTSPISNWGNAEGLKNGDLHYWGVWHGDSAFSSFKNNVGRFVSEWGFQSYPDSALLSHYIDPKELFLGSPAVNRLQRSYKTDKPIWDAIARELGVEKPTTLGGFIEASQRVQAKAYRLATEAHIAAQPHCMGTLLWQLNDCWPGPSWSIIDYKGNPKPAYFEVQKVFTTSP
ncbi:MAG: hypothetical protein KBA60_04700 [Flavobacteriales bacterium]|nr:hypothetical protein [Flavobacteriales bacterium]